MLYQLAAIFAVPDSVMSLKAFPTCEASKEDAEKVVKFLKFGTSVINTENTCYYIHVIALWKRASPV